MALLTVEDGRTVHYAVAGAASSRAFVFHHGQPGVALPWDSMVDLASQHGWTTIMVTRPGYGQSDRVEGRRVADVAADPVAVLDELGIDDFVTVGWSGGGPHALACAALLPDRCRAVATVAGVGPYAGVSDLDFTAGMGPENAEEFAAILAGDPDIEERVRQQVEAMADLLPEDLVAALGGLVSQADAIACQNSEFADYLARSIRMSATNGYYGYWDDGQAFVTDWGFDLEAMTVPVVVWWAGQDLMVPPAHGVWLTEHVAGARGVGLEDEGHLSLILNRMPEILADLASTVR